jgi:hypothetical protein
MFIQNTTTSIEDIVAMTNVFLARRSVQHLVLTNKIHCFRFKVKSYDLFESTYNTNLILPLPLSMPEFLKRKMKCLICVDFFFPRQLLRLPQWNLCHWNQTGVRNFLPHFIFLFKNSGMLSGNGRIKFVL